MILSNPMTLKVNAVRDELLEVERVHPNSRHVKLLHARLEELLTLAKDEGLLDNDDYVAAGGGTPKTQ